MKIEQATAAQRAAIESRDPEIIVLAGPGAGKTATTVARICRILSEGVEPSKIASLTFTNAGAGELQRRLPKKADGEPVELGFCGTLHSFALRMLKEYGADFGYGERVAIVGPESAADLIASKSASLGCKTPLKELLLLKQAGRPPRTSKLTVEQTVLASYFDELRDAGIVDYDVLLTEFREMLKVPSVREAVAGRFLYLFVDEVQDSAPVDWEIYDLFPAGHKFLVGDSDQAIFSFRGGRVQEMLARAERPDFRLVKLEENFRSCAEVCAAANNLIRNNVNRVPKETRSVAGAGGQVAVKEPFATEGGEIGWVAQEIKALLETGGPNGAPSVAVLSRTNAIAAAFRATLAACKIPVVSREVSGLPRDWNYARSFVELLNAPENDALAFFYLIADFEQNGQTPKRARELAHAARRDAASKGQSINSSLLKFGKFTSPELALQALASQRVSKEAQALAVERYRDLPPGATMLDFALSLAEVRERVSEGKEDGAVHVLTGHGAKGMEFDAVFVVGCEDELYPGSREDPEESRRLLYVCLTRARRLLYLTGCQTRMSPWRKSEALKRNPSRFLKEIQL